MNNLPTAIQARPIAHVNPQSLGASKVAKVTISSVEWKYESSLSFGHYVYAIETQLKTQDDVRVTHRYTEFEELHKLLQLQHPGCIVPPIPPKAAAAKLKGAESDEVV